MRKIVRVTRKNIKQGKRCNSTLCPVARAIKSTFPNMVRISVGNGALNYYPPGRIFGLEVELPIKAQKFIDRFDDKKPVKPFSFSISL